MAVPKQHNVLVALSGGVDSSVAAALLVRAGYHATGAFMKQWSDSRELTGVCSWKKDRRDALRVAAHLGIPMLTLDFEKEYKEKVAAYLFEEYRNSRTANPDVLCNKYIKFGAWLKKAQELGFDALATGHYARLKRGEGGGMHLLQAKDKDKDQSYFLHQLSQDQLSQAMFPIGEYTKKEVRELARRFGLPTAERPESMGICFVGEMPMKTFLQQNIPVTPGPVVTTDGRSIGTHEGLPFYTIGQRHGFTQKGDARPLYVTAKREQTNELVVGYDDDPLLYTSTIRVIAVHWTDGQAHNDALHCTVRFRHRQPLQEAVVKTSGDSVSIETKTPQRAIAPGQFAVLYKGEECLGGGVIAAA